MFNRKDDFWMFEAAASIIKAVNAANEGDAKKLKQSLNGFKHAQEKILADRKGAN